MSESHDGSARQSISSSLGGSYRTDASSLSQGLVEGIAGLTANTQPQAEPDVATDVVQADGTASASSNAATPLEAMTIGSRRAAAGQTLVWADMVDTPPQPDAVEVSASSSAAASSSAGAVPLPPGLVRRGHLQEDAEEEGISQNSGALQAFLDMSGEQGHVGTSW